MVDDCPNTDMYGLVDVFHAGYSGLILHNGPDVTASVMRAAGQQHSHRAIRRVGKCGDRPRAPLVRLYTQTRPGHSAVVSPRTIETTMIMTPTMTVTGDTASLPSATLRDLLKIVRCRDAWLLTLSTRKPCEACHDPGDRAVNNAS